MRRIAPLLLLSLSLSIGCNAQDPMAGIAKSHIDGNVPDSDHFDEYLKRDLRDFLCKEKEGCRVEYSLLRDGPTQTGIAYPKFYVWVKCFQKNGSVSEGAARLAAIERKRFDVTDFLSREQIKASPSQVRGVFPAALVDKIFERAG